MKISIAQSNIWYLTCDEFEYYTRIRKCGFRYIDYNFFTYLGTDDSRYMQIDWRSQCEKTMNHMAKLGMGSKIAHAPSGEPAAPASTHGLLRRTQRAIECCGEMGIENLVYHPGGQMGMTHKEYMDFNVNYVRCLIPTLEKHHVNLLLENVGRWDESFYDHDADEMLELIDAVNHPLYHACLDTGHLSLQDGDQYQTIRQLGSHLKGLHIQDNFGSLPVTLCNRAWRQDLHVAPLMGCVDFDEVMRGLLDIGFDGLFNIESESPRCSGDSKSAYVRDEKLRYMNLELVEEYYTWIYDVAKHVLTTYGAYEG